MRRSLTAVLLLLAILSAACAKPRIDTTTDETLKRSVERVRASLPEARRSAFDTALQSVFFGQLDFAKLMTGAAGAASVQADFKTALNGKTGEEVIAYAEDLKKQREAKEREQALGEIKELETKKAQAAQAKVGLADFSVVRSRFSKKAGILGEQPVIELTVKNGTTKAVSRAFF